MGHHYSLVYIENLKEMDKVSLNARSHNMKQIKSKNTYPEIMIRKALHCMGYRFRINYKNLIGTPDIVIVKGKIAIFVNGCFWHRHQNCKEASSPKTNREYWELKLNKNVERDKRNIDTLKSEGWRSIVIWECQVSPNKENNIQLIKKLLTDVE